MIDLVALTATVHARPPVGQVRLVTIDGWSGTGKSRLAEALAQALGQVPVLTLDDLYPGWDGLVAAITLAVNQIAAPLIDGRSARWQRYDWAAALPAEWHETPHAGVVVLEGCGAGAAPLRPYTSTVIWVDAPQDVRDRRLRARADWAGYEPHAQRWAAQEEKLRAADRTREHADVILDNSDEFVRSASGAD